MIKPVVALPTREHPPVSRIMWVWFQQELRLLVREPVAVFFSLAFPLVIYVFIGIPYANIEVGEGIRFIDTMVPGLIGTVGSNLLLMGMPIYLSELRTRGVTKRYRTLPLPGWVFAVAVLAAMMVLVVFSYAVVLTLVGIRHGLLAQIANPLFVILNIALLAWLSCLGFMLGALHPHHAGAERRCLLCDVLRKWSGNTAGRTSTDPEGRARVESPEAVVRCADRDVHESTGGSRGVVETGIGHSAGAGDSGARPPILEEGLKDSAGGIPRKRFGRGGFEKTPVPWNPRGFQSSQSVGSYPSSSLTGRPVRALSCSTIVRCTRERRAERLLARCSKGRW